MGRAPCGAAGHRWSEVWHPRVRTHGPRSPEPPRAFFKVVAVRGRVLPEGVAAGHADPGHCELVFRWSVLPVLAVLGWGTPGCR